MSEVVYNDETLEKRISLCLPRFGAIKVGLPDPPFEVFEAIVKEQVDKLEPPIKNAVNSVIEKLYKTIRICTEYVSFLFIAKILTLINSVFSKFS